VRGPSLAFELLQQQSLHLRLGQLRDLLGGSAQLEAHVCAGALDLAAARWPYHRVIVRTDCAPVVRSRMPSSDSFRVAVHEVRERCRRGWRVVRYVSRKANPAHELAREGLKSISRQPALAAA